MRQCRHQQCTVIGQNGKSEKCVYTACLVAWVTHYFMYVILGISAYMERIGATISSEAIRMPSSAMRPVSRSAHVGSPLVFPWPNTWTEIQNMHQCKLFFGDCTMYQSVQHNELEALEVRRKRIKGNFFSSASVNCIPDISAVFIVPPLRMG